MKKSLCLLMLLHFTANAQEPMSPTCSIGSDCNPTVGDPILSTCFADMEKILARAIDMAGLSQVNSQIHWPDGSGGSHNCNDPFFTNTLGPFPNDLKCSPVGGYNPDRYCQDITVAVELNATLLLNVASSWGDDFSRYHSGSAFLRGAAQAVYDINARYDCEGKRRPVIGASILEHVDISVNNLPIPQFVKTAFQTEINSSPSDMSYYATATYFKKDRITPPGDDHPNISYLEARMYFYYLATLYIDRGYKQITPDYISYSVLHHGSDPTGYFTYNVLTKVRAYAASKNSLLIIPSYLPGVNFYYGTNLLFDYRFSAVRPEEKLTATVTGCTPSTGGSAPDSRAADVYWYLPEASAYLSSGTSPASNCYYGDPSLSAENRMPFLTSFDWHSGTCLGGPGPNMNNYNGPNQTWCVWGYDEARYFNNLSPNCQAGWADYIYTSMRSFSHRGFFAMPGRLSLKNGNPPANPSEPDYVNGSYRMINNPNLFLKIKTDIWSVNPSPSYSYTPLGCVNGQNAYLVSVDNPDKSTIYTWHVQNPDGSWQPYTYGTSRIVIPGSSGVHDIGVRCENWGYPYAIAPYGVIVVTKYLNLTKASCKANPVDTIELKAQLQNLSIGDIIKEFNLDTSNNSMLLSSQLSNFDGKIDVYPNPADNNLTITFPDNISPNVNISFFTTMGQLVKQIAGSVENQTFKIDISSLSTGIYQLKVRSGSAYWIRTVSIIK